MASNEELYTALRNADAAGDTEAATRLATYIKTLPPAPPATPIQGQRSGAALEPEAMQASASAEKHRNLFGPFSEQEKEQLRDVDMPFPDILPTAAGAKIAQAGGVGKAIGSGLKNLGSSIGGFIQHPIDSVMSAIGGKNSQKILQDAMQAHGPEDIAQASKTMQQGQQVGIPLMGPEAFPQGSKIQQVASNVAASPASGGKMQEFMAQRPDQIKAATGQELYKYGKPVGVQEAANQAQEAATTTIKDAERARTAAVNPSYDAAKQEWLVQPRTGRNNRTGLPEIIPPTEAQLRASPAVGPVLKNIDTAIVNNAHLPEVQQDLAKIRHEIVLSGGNVKRLEDTLNTWQEHIDLPAINPKSLDKRAARLIGDALKPLDEMLSSQSKNIAQGRAKYSEISKKIVDPLKQGPVGALAGKGYDPQVAASIDEAMSQLRSKATPARIKEISSKLRTVDKEAFPNLARAHLTEKWNEALEDVQAGDNRMSGANFRKAIEGSPNDRGNTRAIIEEVARSQGQNPNDALQGWKKLMNVLEATGRIPGMGSQTASRQEMQAIAKSTGVTVRPLKAINDYITEVVHRKAYGELAEIFTSPDAVQKMTQLAKLPEGSPKSMALAASIFRIADHEEKSDTEK